MTCVFCGMEKAKYIAEDENFFSILDEYPVSLGHTLIISKSHYDDWFCLPQNVQASMPKMITAIKDHLQRQYNPDGFNIGMNCGRAAGQTVLHFHCHVIPRYAGDVPNPKGGVRGAIPAKMSY